MKNNMTETINSETETKWVRDKIKINEKYRAGEKARSRGGIREQKRGRGRTRECEDAREKERERPSKKAR